MEKDYRIHRALPYIVIHCTTTGLHMVERELTHLFDTLLTTLTHFLTLYTTYI